MSGLKTFTVAGAGELGKYVIEALLKLEKEGKVSSVSFLTRKDSGNDELVAKGAKRVVADYTSPSSLASALNGVDVVVSTLSGSQEALDSQEALAKASKKAGVKIFVPSEFGTPTEGSDHPLFIRKDNFRTKLLKELGLPYAAIYTGPFADVLLSPPYAKGLGFDIDGGKIVIKGSGVPKISFTTRADIASYLAYILTSLPLEKLEWRVFRIEADRVSLNDIAEIFVNRLGKKAEITHESRSALEEALKQSHAHLMFYLILLWDKGGGVVADTDDRLDNKEYPDWNPKKVEDILTEYFA